MKVPYRKTSLSEVSSLIDTTKDLALDTETQGFYQRIRLAQFYQRDWPEVLLVEYPNQYELATVVDTVHIVAHNVHYEITTIQQQTGTRWMPKSFDDTFLLARLHFPQKESFSLDDVTAYVLGYDLYTKLGLEKKKLQGSDWSVPVLSDAQLLYAAADVYKLLDVYDEVKQQRVAFSYKLDKLTLGYCADFQWNGMPVDKARMFEEFDSITEKLNAIVLPVNANSPKQVKEWLGVDSTGDIELACLELDPTQTELCYFGVAKPMPRNEAAGLVRKTRKLKKQLSFIKKFEETMLSELGILGKFKPSARSGRLTSDDQNLQQLPRSLKCCFGTKPGSEVLIYADYAQIELRHICAITECKTMEKLFREGRDLHSYTTDMIFETYENIFDRMLQSALDTAETRRGNVVSEEDYQRIRAGVESEAKKLYKRYRQISKTCNFSLLYGGGIAMFISILIKTASILLTEVEANKIRQKWRNLWREIYAWQERGIAMWRKGKLGSTPLGRHYSAKMMTDQLNIENQGGAADVNKLAMHYLAPRLAAYNEQHGTNYCIANNIHDSYILRGEDNAEHYKAVAVILAECMQLAWFECSKALKVKDIPMPVNVKVGYNWGDIEDDDVPDLYSFDLEPYVMLEKAQ
ncbi:putative DNA polymerase [Edwardsiella phage ETP-1]|uniref:Putative DNA polymerase n=1 Tax=Edwardsiella phage ETP-1 TaxID=2544920 RepID=A0A6G5P4Y8_9CAUD|nr:putative DNA polymerase [Edwardsiella phage ETP-1]UIS54078.1 putative DNA polymerase [Edwardsiella phage vB_EpP_ZHX]